jgi:hypothetical protein
VISIVPTRSATFVRATKYAARVCGHRLRRVRSRRGGRFRRRSQCRGEQPGRERPHPPKGDPDPRVGHGVAHVPAACLRSCMVCAHECRELSTQDPIANASDNSPRYPSRFAVDRSLQWRDDVIVDLTSLSPPGCSEITRPSRCGFSRGARRRQRSPLRFDRASRTACGR